MGSGVGPQNSGGGGADTVQQNPYGTGQTYTPNWRPENTFLSGPLNQLESQRSAAEGHPPGQYGADGTYTPLNPTGKASDMAASVLAGEYANWESTYKPVELNLLNQSSLNNPAVLTNAVNSAKDSATQMYGAMPGVQDRKMASMGIAPTAQQSAVSNRITSLSQAAAVAGGANQARQNVRLEDQMISLGSAPNPNLVQGSASPNIGG